MNLQETHTSLELSKWLKENGFEKRTHKYWIRSELRKWQKKENKEYGYEYHSEWGIGDSSIEERCEDKIESAPCYDILNDLCVRYADEIWGKGDISIYEDNMKEKICKNVVLQKDIVEAVIKNITMTTSLYHTCKFVELLQNDKKEEAEEYIMKHSILNN